ncbi:MAG: glutamyl-tRNA reductase [Candidatus Omnitrophica bacterium]|nr:glutamyl-tRNA reductase [Candidatus Omnitrophota bacterium]
MQILTIGINHNTAPIEIREKFYLNTLQQDLYLSDLQNNPAIAEAFVLSTCNRTEIYLHVIESLIDPFSFVEKIATIKKSTFDPAHRKYFYIHQEDNAVKHLLEVSAGLNSLVLGEKQILGQVKDAFERAQTRGLFLRNFNLLSNTAIRTGKKARTETDICRGGSSVSWAAIHKAEKELGTLENKSVLLIGAGKMSELALGQIRKKGVADLYLMNRTHKNALDLAQQYGGEAVEFCDIKEILAKVDLCICSASAPHYILEKNTIQRIQRLRQNSQRLVFVDISMPRNIEPQVNDLENVSLFSIDDLQEVVNMNMLVREKAIHDVEEIILQKIQDYKSKLQKTALVSTKA